MAEINEEKGPAGKYQKLGAHSAAFWNLNLNLNLNLILSNLSDPSMHLIAFVSGCIWISEVHARTH